MIAIHRVSHSSGYLQILAPHSQNQYEVDFTFVTTESAPLDCFQGHWTARVKKWDALPGRAVTGVACSAGLRDLPSPADTFQSRAQTEPLDTDLQRGTATPKQMLQKRFETASAPYRFIHLHDLAQSELPPTRPNGHIIPQAPKKDSNLGKSEAHFARETDEKDAVQRFIWVAALAARAAWRLEDNRFLVEANG